MTAVVTTNRGVGDLLREWRQRRRRSQLDLALGAEVSARHLSFVETGRSRPSRELLLHLADHLDVPLRDRNALLLAAGYAPLYPEHTLDDDVMTPVRVAVDKVLAGHEPFPALVADRQWNLVAANAPAMAFLGAYIAPELLEPPINVLRAALHPRGMAPQIANLGDYSAHVMHRVHQQVAVTQDPDLVALYNELLGYPGVEPTSPAVFAPESLVFTTLRLGPPPGAEGPVLSFFSTIATFGTYADITSAELVIESFFPADPVTERALQAT
jgi:transcriptional regulator with XRE-family HTH domain